FELGIKIREEDDLEFLFSIDGEPTDQSLCAIQSFLFEALDSSSNDPSEGIYMLQAKVLAQKRSRIKHFINGATSS
ncbi:hypothetical protein J1N35_037965, partial [Gossypium stocksii]